MQQAYAVTGSRTRYALLGILIYTLLTWISSLLLLPDSQAPVLWLPVGVALVCLLHGSLYWVLPIMAGNLIGQWLWLSPQEGTSWLTLSGTALLLTLEPLAIARLYRQLPSPSLSRQPAFVRLMAMTTVATAGVALALAWLLYRHIPLPLNQVFLQLWLSHMLAVALVTPLLISAPGDWLTLDSESRMMESLLWLVSLALILMLILPSPLPGHLLLLPWMIWAVTRFSLPLAILSLALTTLASLWLLYLGQGTMLLYGVLLVMVGSASYLHSLLTDRNELARRLHGKVRDSNQQLEQKNQELRDEIYVRKQAEKAFRRSTRHYRALVETASNPILVIDCHSRIRQWNSAAEALFGYSREEAMGRDLLSTFIPDAFRDELGWKITKVLQSGVPREHVEIQIQGYNGLQRSILWNLTRLEDEDETVETRVILIGQDITEIRETQDQLHYLAHYDILTGTANRRLFEDRCHQAIERALRYNHRCALISLDV
ncbi:MAG: PAS domain S-box protein, partial [Oleiphilaceae bacterium]|nr:PAS domain S-box protein [Oleiphilaceae bacterium]